MRGREKPKRQDRTGRDKKTETEKSNEERKARDRKRTAHHDIAGEKSKDSDREETITRQSESATESEVRARKVGQPAQRNSTNSFQSKRSHSYLASIHLERTTGQTQQDTDQLCDALDRMCNSGL